mmetsp:Transcript_4133/g.13834  ORF Transcript_4133/g.13834 Transcript_4133/m.13834 type:complete len:205 (+) Transcript_4133:50-664(+)
MWCPSAPRRRTRARSPWCRPPASRSGARRRQTASRCARSASPATRAATSCRSPRGRRSTQRTSTRGRTSTPCSRTAAWCSWSSSSASPPSRCRPRRTPALGWACCRPSARRRVRAGAPRRPPRSRQHRQRSRTTRHKACEGPCPIPRRAQRRRHMKVPDQPPRPPSAWRPSRAGGHRGTTSSSVSDRWIRAPEALGVGLSPMSC